ncbi:DNA polymerase III subunit alpha [Gloeobacter kilaueensis]|uniref:DNA polymerase III subunit alpha n=1 Tax=Gloeobacter kilaueensis (strain ATCC BAA-2537 / CCAP 1431/1 / ULC 316 / JS1) TaxID=1183438 RepID=U5QK68_GLOK1|nr:DNA polymerase III subunit alpha [Gloeobacter kilaueensis]AGY59347.1 DNA polymerase III subunit alpha [Gloeobacter kilaueensis JS1]
MQYVNLHTHSDYSLLDGASQVPDLIERARSLEMPAIALTDHGVMYGAVELIKKCRSAGLKPIVGTEGYVINGDIRDKTRRYRRYHQVLLAKNLQGYKNLVKLVTISHLEGMQGRGIFARPCINKELLTQYREGLICTSACLGGEIPQQILNGTFDQARRIAQWYKELFADDFYLEIQDHGQREDRVVNVALLRLSRELHIKLIATNDSHFTSCEDVDAHDALLCIQTGKLVSEENRMRYTGTEFLKSAEQMASMFRDHLSDEVIAEALANTLEIAEKVERYDRELLGDARLPQFPIPRGHTAESYLEQVSWEGMRERFGSQIDPVYRDRLKYELGIIEQMGFATYFLVVWDYIKYARDHSIAVGPGRGSAAGSLVAYALKITNIDPVRYNLLFERFLNPERKSMPDIDTDFCIERRDEIIRYVTEKYGEEYVAQIITFNRLTSKAVLKDVARVLDISYGDADRLAKLIPVVRGKPVPLKKMISEETPAPEFKHAYESDERTRKWVDLSMRIEGTNKTFGVHAAGVVISSIPLDELVPLQKNNDGQVITQYYMEDIADLGLLKMDFLGLRNLTMIYRAQELIGQYRGEHIDLDNLPLDDPQTYALLGKADLEGIFQLESSGMKQIVRDLRPSNIEDISSILALYRPGPLDAGLIPEFIDRKHGRKQIQYLHTLLEPILKETYGVLCYQEQIMKVAQELGGYTLGQADLLRRAMGKKKREEMEKHRSIFVDGSAKNGVPSRIAEELFEQMVVFAEYCFNKSHSAAYGYVTFQTAYLKAHYPVEYMAALLSSVKGDQDKVQKYIASCLSMGIEIEPPDINRSGFDFTPQDKSILFGLGAVKNVGEGAIQALIEARAQKGAFRNLADLCDRVDLRVVNKRALEALVKAGAFDSFSSNRGQLLADMEKVVDWAQDRAHDRSIGQFNLFDAFAAAASERMASFESAPSAPPTADLLPADKLRFERELLGFYVSDHPLKAVRESARLLAPINLADLADCRVESSVSAIALVRDVKAVVTKKGDRMAIVQLEDLTGSTEAVVFPRVYERVGPLFVTDARLMLWGKIDLRDERPQLIIQDAKPIEEVKMVVIDLEPRSDVQTWHQLRELLQAHQSETAHIPVIASIKNDQRHKLIRFGHQFRISNDSALIQALARKGFAARLARIVN